MQRRGSAVALMVLLAAGACERGTPEPPQLPTVVPRPAIEFVGCRHLDPHANACHLRPGKTRTLRVWIDVRASADVRVALDGEAVEVEAITIGAGLHLQVPVPEHASRLRIAGRVPSWTEPFELDIIHERPPKAVSQALDLYLGGDPTAALARLDSQLDELAGVDRLLALQLAWKLMHGVGDPRLLAYLEQTRTLASALGRPRERAEAAATAVGASLEGGDRAAARRWLRSLEAIELPEARIWAGYYGGMLMMGSGDLGGSVRALGRARELARRVGRHVDFLNASESLSAALADLGRGDEALALARDTLALARSGTLRCLDRARVLGNVGWALFLLSEQGLPHDPPWPLLAEGLAAVEEGGECPDPVSAAYARVHLARVALAEQEPHRAWRRLAMLRAGPLPPQLVPWVDEIEARVGLQTGRWHLLPPLMRTPGDHDDPRLRWRSAMTRAGALERIGLHTAAIDAYIAAEEVLMERLSTVSIGNGREPFLAGRQASAQRLVALLVEQGRSAEALCRARLARGRALHEVNRSTRLEAMSPHDRTRRELRLERVLAARDAAAAERREDWRYLASERRRLRLRRAERIADAMRTLDEAVRETRGHPAPRGCDELPALADDELLLMQFPGGDGAWVFAADHRGVDVVAQGLPRHSPPEHWSLQVLEPLAERLVEAERVRVIPTASGWSVPFHALPVGDGVLLDAAAVVYALDLRPRAAAAPPHSALVVADAAENLPHAQAEAREVARVLSDRGWSVQHYEGPAATREPLLDQLNEVAIFHYAGHSGHDREGGWNAALQLHDGEALGVADILALRRVPRLVILSGCETALVDRSTLSGGMNLARAFVLGGAQGVIAADRRVDDELAATVGAMFHAQQGPGDRLDGAEALRRTQLELRRQQPNADWSAFRVIVP